MSISTNDHSNKESASCKIVPSSVLLKLRGNEKSYQEALETSAKFNKRLLNERKMRMPFIDSQTRVAQTNSMLWLMEYQRVKVHDSEKIYVYPCKKWYKHRRLLFDSNDSNLFNRLQIPPPSGSSSSSETNGMMSSGLMTSNGSASNNNHLINENSNSMDSNYYSNSNSGQQQQSYSSNAQHTLTKQVSNSNDDYEMGMYQSVSSSTNPNSKFHLISSNSNDEWAHNHHSSVAASHLNDDSFENFETSNYNDNDNDTDQDDYEDSKSKKKSKRGKQSKKKAEQHTDDKPFVCERCGVKYKTKPGLSYHIHKAHSNTNSSNAAGASASNTTGSNSMNNHNSNTNHNTDENTTNSVYDSVYDDTSSSLPHTSTNNNNINNNNSRNSQMKNCGICGKEETPTSDKIIACSECRKNFHMLCLNFTGNMVISAKKYNWQCIECKKCTFCGNSENDDKLLFCDDCDRGYHMYCLKPPLNEAPEGNWSCQLCIKEFGSQSSISSKKS